jgi:hypothetical protein
MGTDGEDVLMRRLLLLPLVAFFAATGCAGEEVSPDAAVAEAATKTAEAGSSRVWFEAKMSGTALPDEIEFGGEGEFDYERQTGRLSYDMSELIPGAGTGDLEMVQQGVVFYMKFPAGTDAQLPQGKEWVKFDLAALGEGTGIDLGQLSQLNQGDPSQMLRYLRGASKGVEEVGEEAVRGTDTTHYRADVDLEKAIEQSLDEVPAETREALRESAKRLRELMVGETVPVDVWIDEDGLARRMRLEYGMKAPGQSGDLQMEMTMEFFDFGIDVDARPPPAEETVDIQTLIGQGS